jgi:hypothetical protein
MKNTTSFDLTATSSYDSLQKAAKARCKHTSREGNVGLIFSIFESSYGTPGKDWIVNHPDIFDEGAVFEGKCIFKSDYWRIADQVVYSDYMVNPTWSDIISECNRQLIDPEDGSTAQLFLEGFVEIDPKSDCDCGCRPDDIRMFEISWGS